jgi:hypothetical protein
MSACFYRFVAHEPKVKEKGGMLTQSGLLSQLAEIEERE